MSQGCHARIIQPYGLKTLARTPGGRSREGNRTPQPFLTGRLCWASSGSNSQFSRENGRGTRNADGEGGPVAGGDASLSAGGGEQDPDLSAGGGFWHLVLFFLAAASRAARSEAGGAGRCG